MLPTLLLRQAQTPSSISASVLNLLPRHLPPTLNPPQRGSLYKILSQTPHVEGLLVHQKRWSEYGLVGSYWRITRAEFKSKGKHGKVWGIYYRKCKSPPSRLQFAL
jgi:small subunit ribosomal protein S34